jgi:hypothetical protein
MKPLLFDVLEARVLFSATRVAVIGDFSSDVQTAPTRDVANLVHSWSPDAVVTVGDNNYPDGEASTIDQNIGQWYHSFIAPYKGSYGSGSADGVNRFWPALGNHDWNTPDAQPYLDYFTLPGNERYYTKQIGNVGLFIVDSDPNEPDGVTSTSTQGQWLKSALANSTATWKLVFFHHPAFSSGEQGSTDYMQWPFQSWGASAVFQGHDHDYERIVRNNFPYFVDGLGGDETRRQRHHPDVPVHHARGRRHRHVHAEREVRSAADDDRAGRRDMEIPRQRHQPGNRLARNGLQRQRVENRRRSTGLWRRRRVHCHQLRKRSRQQVHHELLPQILQRLGSFIHHVPEPPSPSRRRRGRLP